MVTAALISSDQRLVQQIQSWARDLASNVRLEAFTELDSFVARFKDLKALPSDPAEAAKMISTLQLEPYRVVIVDLEYLAHLELRPAEWAAEIKSRLYDVGLSDREHPIKVFAMSFGTGLLAPERLRFPVLDDLILKPLDKTVFQQKLEILCSDKPDSTHTFLFRQPIQMVIEAGKDILIDEISEFGFVIRNPRPLVNGMIVAVHSEFFGERDKSRILARVYHSESHAHVFGEYSVRLSYFGLSADQLSRIRKYVKELHAAPKVVAVKKKVAKLTTVESPRKLKSGRVAIIDMDRDHCREMQSAIQETFNSVSVSIFPSYGMFAASFQHLLASPQPVAPIAPTIVPISHIEAPLKAEAVNSADSIEANSIEADEPDRKPNQFTLIVDDNLAIQSIENKLAGAMALGLADSEWLIDSSAWIKRLEPADQSELTEWIDYAKAGGKGHAFLRLRDSRDRVCHFDAVASRSVLIEGETSAKLNLFFNEIEAEAWASQAPQVQDRSRASRSDLTFDAVFVDVGIFRDSFDEWHTKFKALLEQAEVVDSGTPMPMIFIMSSGTSRIHANDCRLPGVADFLFKPLDRRRIGESLQVAVQDEHGPRFELRPGVEPLPHFSHCEVHAKIARDVRMDEVSEYGLSLVMPLPLREGVYLRFFSPMLDVAGEGLLGRCMHCEKIEGDKDKGSYRCYFGYFGPGEETLKQIRTWIKADYVHKKESSANA